VSVADHGHVTAVNTAALAAFDDATPHRSKARIPPGPAARAAADRLAGADPQPVAGAPPPEPANHYVDQASQVRNFDEHTWGISASAISGG
jgi:hypothetical protein